MSSTTTNFLNSKKRRIMIGVRGGFFSNMNGKKVYGMKAMFRKVGAGDVTKIANHGAVPLAIRRKVRGAVMKKSPVMATSTNFLNSKKRRIMQGHSGGFYSNTNGKKVYGMKAMFRKVGSAGPVTKIANHKAVPSPIRRSHKVSMRIFRRKNPFASLMKMRTSA